VVGFDDLEDFRITLVEDRLVDAQVAFENRILVDLGDFDRLVEGYLTCIGDFQAHDDFHQGRFPCPVDPTRAIFCPWAIPKEMLEKSLRSPKALLRFSTDK
jgi:hypothetical protein